MALNEAANSGAGLALRALQLIFAIVVIGTDGYAIHVFHGRTVYDDDFEYGNYYYYDGVPDAWSFLMFCAAWTFLGVVFLLIAGSRFANHKWIGYMRVGVEAVALLSWLAGFIAVAVQIGSNTCPAEENGCGTLKAATVFGALEWVLFVVTTIQTARLVFNRTRSTKTSTTSSDKSIPSKV